MTLWVKTKWIILTVSTGVSTPLTSGGLLLSSWHPLLSSVPATGLVNSTLRRVYNLIFTRHLARPNGNMGCKVWSRHEQYCNTRKLSAHHSTMGPHWLAGPTGSIRSVPSFNPLIWATFTALAPFPCSEWLNQLQLFRYEHHMGQGIFFTILALSSPFHWATLCFQSATLVPLRHPHTRRGFCGQEA